MAKTSYPLANQDLYITTQPNVTYNGNEIPQTIMTTAGVYVQSRPNIKICSSVTQPKSKKS